VAPGGASLGIAMALVRHPVVQGVRPDGDAAEGGGDGGVVDEELRKRLKPSSLTLRTNKLERLSVARPYSLADLQARTTFYRYLNL
jgi:hypothetical protein